MARCRRTDRAPPHPDMLSTKFDPPFQNSENRATLLLSIERRVSGGKKARQAWVISIRWPDSRLLLSMADPPRAALWARCDEPTIAQNGVRSRLRPPAAARGTILHNRRPLAGCAVLPARAGCSGAPASAER